MGRRREGRCEAHRKGRKRVQKSPLAWLRDRAVEARRTLTSLDLNAMSRTFVDLAGAALRI